MLVLGASVLQAQGKASSDYLYVWTASSDTTQPDFLAVFDVRPAPGRYGRLVTTVAVPGRKNRPHHTEHEMPEPREVSRAVLAEQDVPHWIAVEPSHRRVVITGYGTMMHRIVLANFDAATGRLEIDRGFRDDGATEPGLRMDNKSWPHGGNSVGTPHGAVFSLPPGAARRIH